MNWRRYIVLIGSAVAIAAGVKWVIACADGPDPYDEPTFFFNTINGQPEFTPFYYTPYLQLYTDSYWYDEHGAPYKKWPDANISAWERYTAGAVPAADIDSFVYRYAAKDVMSIFEHIRKGYTLKVPPVVAQNKFTKWLIASKDHEAALYLSFAKRCERYAHTPGDEWKEKSFSLVAKTDSAMMQELVHEGIKLHAAATGKEIKQRYAYQAMRMAFYSHEYPQTLMLWKTLAVPGNHIMYYRCKSLMAGALYHTNRRPEAAFAYMQVFDSSDELKESAYLSFLWSVNGNISILFPYCRNDHERALLYIMRGLYDYADGYNMAATIRSAYELDPKARGIEILMTRAINKLERGNVPQVRPGNKVSDSVLNELNTLARRIAAEGKCGSPAFWLLSSAYLYLMDGEPAGARRMLDKAGELPMTVAEKDAHFILDALHTTTKRGKINAATEKELLPVLQALEQRAKTDNRYSSLFRNMLTMVLVNGYLAQADTIRAIYCYSKSYTAMGARYEEQYGWDEDFTNEAGAMLEHMSPSGLREVQDFVLRKRKTDFEEWLTDKSRYPADVLYELEGTKHIRLLHFREAVEALSKAGSVVGPVLPDAFVSHVSDNSNWNRSDSAVTYDKLTFSKRMLELQNKLEQDPDDGRAAYQYANGLYSMSYYGKAYAAYTYYRSTSDDRGYYNSDARNGLQPHELEFYDVHLAAQYYKVAFDNSTSPEVKARCLFMMAKCWQKNCPADEENRRGFRSWGEHLGYYRYALTNPYFKDLESTYGKTAFYTSALKTCSYLRDYAKKRR